MSESSSPGWPSPDRADDEHLARSLAAGNDPEALIRLLDRYSGRLYDYCHALLRDQESAAGALHDALLAAYAHVGRLAEPDRFRGWLYALVRNECLRRLQDPHRPAERHEAPEVEDMFLSAEERARQQDTRRMVHNALATLRGRERESLDLLLRHGLDVQEIAAVLAIDAQEAGDLVGDARRRLDDALAAVVIARTGREDCPSVAAMVPDPQAPLPQPAAYKLIRHIQTCAVCTERRHRTVSTAGLLQVLPVAMMPADLRGHIISTATDPAYAGDLGAIARRAEPFDAWGWPLPAERSGYQGDDQRRGGPPRLWPAIAAAAAVIVLAVGAFLVVPGGSDDRTSAQGPTGSPSAPEPSESPADPSESPSETPTPTPTTSSPTPTPTPTTPTPTRTRTSRPPSPPQTSRPPARGSLAVGSCSMANEDQDSCSFTVTAVGGPVIWSISGGSVRAAPGGGRLDRGESATVTASRPNGPCEPGSGTVSFFPNGVASVSWSCQEN
ncbi:RNA polymerase sigma factor [Actinomadura sp. SCN-SB]|uniref:RNA polymerase sigma factor n=1 Tax=Actinomadura sp. SCN-SB TaxID=3373092 RepID=UPI00375241B7